LGAGVRAQATASICLDGNPSVVVTRPGTASGRWSPVDRPCVGPAPGTSIGPIGRPTPALSVTAKQRQLSLVEIGERAARENRDGFSFRSRRSMMLMSGGLSSICPPWVARACEIWASMNSSIGRGGTGSKWRMSEPPDVAIVMNTPEAALRLRTAFPSAVRIVAVTSGYGWRFFRRIPASSCGSQWSSVISIPKMAVPGIVASIGCSDVSRRVEIPALALYLLRRSNDVADDESATVWSCSWASRRRMKRRSGHRGSPHWSVTGYLTQPSSCEPRICCSSMQGRRVKGRRSSGKTYEYSHRTADSAPVPKETPGFRERGTGCSASPTTWRVWCEFWLNSRNSCGAHRQVNKTSWCVRRRRPWPPRDGDAWSVAGRLDLSGVTRPASQIDIGLINDILETLRHAQVNRVNHEGGVKRLPEPLRAGSGIWFSFDRRGRNSRSR
jgi:hypothetical protein